MSAEQKPLQVTVIVPAFNSADTLPACLNSLQRQTRVPDEIIVVDDDSLDQTAQVAERLGVRVLRQSHAGPAAARNLGARVARGDIVMFTDSDCEPRADWVEQMLKPFADPRVMGAKGTYITRQSELLARLVQVEFEDKYARMRRQGTIDFVDTYAAAYRRDIFVRLEGFNEIFPTASVEDIELSFRLSERKARLVFAPQAQVLHTHPVSLKRYLARKARYGYWRALVYLWHPRKISGDSHTDPMLKTQFVLVGLVGVSTLAGLLNPYWLGLTLLVMGLLVATTLPFAIRANRRDSEVAWIVPPVHTIRAIVQAGALGVGLLVHGFLRRNHKLRIEDDGQ
ncbi:MAG: glycosyltransferase [Chloroflexi bacterium]|nr:glycosyltransferase [Chloroflexota bacterium]